MVMSVPKHSVGRKSRRRFLALATELESALLFDDASGIKDVVDTALSLKEFILCNSLPLKTAEKVRVLKTLSRARVRMCMSSIEESSSAFAALDGISMELMEIL